MQKVLMMMLLGIMYIATTTLGAAPFKNLPMEITQPNGDTYSVYASGDEFFNYYHDENGYTIIQGQDGIFYYATKSGDEVVPSVFSVGSVNPATTDLTANVKISEAAYKAKRQWFDDQMAVNQRNVTEGTLNNIVVYIRFADQTEFPTARSVFDAKFNNQAEGAQSMYTYYQEVSYQALEIDSYHYPVCDMTTNLSYQDTQTRGYFSPYNASTNPTGYQSDSDARSREKQLLLRAINGISSQVPTSLVIDADGNGTVDNVCFIIRGGNGAWADLLWAHRSWLTGVNAIINGKRVYDYTFQPVTQNETRTLCHEMFHSIGAPDLYHYSYDGDPVGNWDLMNSGFVHMMAYMKYRYAGWVPSIPQISTSGYYELNALTSSTNNCYKIASPNSSSEYLMIEYRKRTPGTYEANCPGEGLIAYRINTQADGDGNTYGPPDEIYIFRPDGTPSEDGNINIANFSQEVGRTTLSDDSEPAYAFLSNGNEMGIHLHQLHINGDTASFYLNPSSGFIQGQVAIAEGDGNLTDVVVKIDDIEMNPDETGGYFLSQFEGQYQISAELPGYETIRQDVELGPEEFVTIDFNMVLLPAPTDVSYSFTASSITLNWDFDNYSENFEQFLVYISLNNGTSFSRFQTTTEPTITLSLPTTINYQFYIIAEYSTGTSIPSGTLIVDYTPNSDPHAIVELTTLDGNYPNPFNPSTEIRYSLAEQADVEISIYNVLGQKVNSFTKQAQSQGTHSITWEGQNSKGQTIGSGVYFYSLKVNGQLNSTKKMLLMK